MSPQPLRIGMIAGEASGDILGAGLIAALREQHPDLIVEGIVGPRMLEQGAKAIFSMDELSVMGFAEVIGRLPRILSVRKQIIRHFLDNPPDIVVGIDAPDFNLGVELKLHQQGIRTIHYVSPSVWAWKQKRIFKIAKATDLVLAFLPFEKAFYDKFAVPCRFIGHTLADQIPLQTPQQPARSELGLDDEAQVLTLMPGSRHSEIALIAPEFLAVAKLLNQRLPHLQLVVPMVSEQKREQFLTLQREHAPELSIVVTVGQSRQAMAAADAILLASGTAALEAMLVKRPMVVAYKVKPLTYWIAKKLVKTPYVSLPNLLAQRMLVPEYIQDECRADVLSDAIYERLTTDQQPLLDTFSQLHQHIRCGADQQAAQAVLDVVAK